MPLKISENLEIPDRLLALAFVRSRGPGGRNVNKLNTRAELSFDLAGWPDLPPAPRRRLQSLAGRRLTNEGRIVLSCDIHREQGRNRQEVLDRLARLVRAALVRPKPRKPTRPTRASKEKRLKTKREKGEKKERRRPVRPDF